MAKKVSKYITDPEVLEQAKKDADEFVESYVGKTITPEELEKSRERLNKKMEEYFEEHKEEKAKKESRGRIHEKPKGNLKPKEKREYVSKRRQEKIDRMVMEANGEHILEKEKIDAEKEFTEILEDNKEVLVCLKNGEYTSENALEPETCKKEDVVSSETIEEKEEVRMIKEDKKAEKPKQVFNRPYYHMGMRVDY